MPPRYAYWTIIAGGLPTAFRTTEREELLPTFRRIKQKHPDAEMKYFARGRLWHSPAEARVEAEARRAAAAQRQNTRGGTSRGRDWRPGGEHRDPRQKFKDAKKVRNRDRRQHRFDRRQKSDSTERPGETPARQAPRAPRTEWRDRGLRGGKPGVAGDRSWRDRPSQDNRRGEPSRREPSSHDPKAGDLGKPAPPRPKGRYGSSQASGLRKPAPRPWPPGSGSHPAGPPHRDRNQRGPTKDRRRRS